MFIDRALITIKAGDGGNGDPPENEPQQPENETPAPETREQPLPEE